MGDFITVTVCGWAKYNPRKDIKHPSWFAFHNRMLEDDEFSDFSGDEIKAWVYILSRASQKSSDTIVVSYSRAERVCKIKRSCLETTLKKLESFGIVHVTNVPVRDPNVSVQTRDSTDTTDTHTNNIPHPRVFDLEAVYEKYPRKQGKQKGISRLKAQIKSDEDYECLCLALSRYVEHCRANQTEHRFIKHFDTWVSTWRDWLDPSTGTVEKLRPIKKREQYVPPKVEDNRDLSRLSAEEITAMLGQARKGM